jgi:hypothetical protein
MALLHCPHHRCGEWSNGDGHAQPHDNHSREKGDPIAGRATGDTGQREEGKADGGDHEADHPGRDEPGKHLHEHGMTFR